jgi:hypothetical protein
MKCKYIGPGKIRYDNRRYQTGEILEINEKDLSLFPEGSFEILESIKTDKKIKLKEKEVD